MRRHAIAIGAYAVAVYLAFLAVLAYGVGFFADAVMPRTVDHGPRTGPWTAAAVDLALLSLFAVQHTVMARPGFKRAWTRIVPPAAERSTFVLAATLVQALLFWQWRPIGATVWVADGPPATAILVVYALGWVLVVVATHLVDHADLFGLAQARARMRGVTHRPPAFTERGLYRYLRHPLMAGFLVVFWAAPTMTVGHVLLAAASTAYILVGIAFEERDLLRELGPVYRAYRARVPALIPLPQRRRARTVPDRPGAG